MFTTSRISYPLGRSTILEGSLRASWAWMGAAGALALRFNEDGAAEHGREHEAAGAPARCPPGMSGGLKGRSVHGCGGRSMRHRRRIVRD